MSNLQFVDKSIFVFLIIPLFFFYYALEIVWSENCKGYNIALKIEELNVFLGLKNLEQLLYGIQVLFSLYYKI